MCTSADDERTRGLREGDGLEGLDQGGEAQAGGCGRGGQGHQLVEEGEEGAVVDGVCVCVRWERWRMLVGLRVLSLFAGMDGLGLHACVAVPICMDGLIWDGRSDVR